ncbi:deoxyribose-phosphate aldolase [Pseudoalteromonas sp. MMG012]|uniref:deoxyribose-phosphate aldolase n=1 Tax=Pseudoalteromonas sp. MMG012 TaxID=2822686 RepID=UPI001B39D20B|nr:deoxyribose-phosphate aldolase [Pseudoalteromonas sp. MMG012]MBQ4852252.1 deoxyribose-phosphate aldolase [Pseudoalteromonas sp. MMG012]
MTRHSSALLALSLMDLTSLNDSDSESSISDLINSIDVQYTLPAAICIYPEFIKHARATLELQNLQQIKIATVTNFPSGEDSLESVLHATEQALQDGASEIDLVLPYKQLIAGDPDTPWEYVHSSKQLCVGKATLKVIIESGQLADAELIAQASEIAILAGADFVKTSTGKVPVNATLEAAEVILNTIKKMGRDVGFKAAGGVKSVQDAQAYLCLAEKIMGTEWICSEHFRFGASSLLKDVYHVLKME